MRILHISDTHLFAPQEGRPRLHHERIEPARALDAVLKRAVHAGPFDALVHTGDASDDGTRESYALLHEMLEGFVAEHRERYSSTPAVAVAMGNHDDSHNFSLVWGPGESGTDEGEQRRWADRVIECEGGRVIVLDTSVPAAGWGSVDPGQLQWLERILASSPPVGPNGEPGVSVIAMHHPPVRTPSRLFNALSFGNRAGKAAPNAGMADDVRERFAQAVHGRVDAILAGHLHHSVSGSIAKVPVFVAPGVVNVVDPLPAGAMLEEETAYPLSGASVLSCEWDGAHWGIVHEAGHWVNAGDSWRGEQDADAPIYKFDAARISQIIAQAGRSGP